MLELVPRTGGETEAQRIIDGCTKDYTVVREEDYCDLDGSRIVSGLKCLALVDIYRKSGLSMGGKANANARGFL